MVREQRAGREHAGLVRPSRPSRPDAGLPVDRATNSHAASAAGLIALQRLAGNRATTSRIEAYRAAAPGGPRRPAPGAIVQRLDIYGRAAGAASALPAATATEFTRLVEAGSQAEALRTVVDAMTARGDLDPRLLRTSGDGELWQVADTGDMAAVASFRAPFADPDDASRRLPNPRFTVGPRMLSPGRPDALERLHTGLLHEYRHVQQAAERVNQPRATGTAREPGYANDPDEFDAYLSEVELSYGRNHMYGVALQAGVHWEFLAAADREPFRSRWEAAQARVQRVLGYDVATLLRSPAAERYRVRMREAEQRAREAWERHAH